MSYIDGFVLPVPKKKVEDYIAIAKKAGAIWREHGALGYLESVAEDVKPGKSTSFPQAVKLKKDEAVVFAWILFKSRAHRDKVNKLVLKDPRIHDMMGADELPLDSKRMIYGGFEVRVELDAAPSGAKKKTSTAKKKKAAAKKK